MTDETSKASVPTTNGGRRSEMVWSQEQKPKQPASAPETKEIGPNIKHFLVMIVAFWVVQFGAQILLAVLSVPFTPTGHLPYFSVAWGIALADLVLVILIYRAFHAQQYVTWRSIGGVSPRQSIPVLVLLVLGALGLIYIIELAFADWLGLEYSQDIEEVFNGLRSQQNTLSYFLLVFSTVIGAPILEEIVFRGFLQTALANRIGDFLAVIISSTIFGLIHFDLDAMPLLIVMGLFLGGLYSITRSIWPSVALHMVNNGLAVYLLFTT